MKLAVTISKCGQIGQDEWKQFYYTKVFDSSNTIDQINDWIVTINKNETILCATISQFYE